MVITGCGGRVHYDPYPTVRYRQHRDNQVGSNQSWGARLVRLRLLLRGRFRVWTESNVQALRSIESLLTPDSLAVLREFHASREGPWYARLFGLWNSGVYRQTVLGNLALLAASLLRKI
jgi:hypothetical protein